MILCLIACLSIVTVGVVDVSAASQLQFTGTSNRHSIDMSVTKFSNAASYRFYYRIQKSNGSWTSWKSITKSASSLKASGNKLTYSMYLDELSPYSSVTSLSGTYKKYDNQGFAVMYDVRALNKNGSFLTSSVDKTLYWLPSPSVDSVEFVKLNSQSEKDNDGKWYMALYADDSYAYGKSYKNYNVFVRDANKNTWANISSAIVDDIKVGNNKWACVVDLEKAALKNYNNGSQDYRFTIRAKNADNTAFISSFFDTCFTVSKGLSGIYTRNLDNDSLDVTIKYVNGNNSSQSTVRYYSSFADAASAVENNRAGSTVTKANGKVMTYYDEYDIPVIKLLTNVSLTVRCEFTRSLTIDLNGKTLTCNGDAFLILDSDVVVKNGTINCNKANPGTFSMRRGSSVWSNSPTVYAIAAFKNLTLSDLVVNYTAPKSTYGSVIYVSNGNSFKAARCSIDVKDTSVTESKNLEGFEVCNYNFASFIDCKFSGNARMNTCGIRIIGCGTFDVDGCNSSINHLTGAAATDSDGSSVTTSAGNALAVNVPSGKTGYISYKKPCEIFGGNAAMGTSGEGTLNIYDGHYHDFEHGGIYNTIDGVLNVKGGLFESTPKTDARAENYAEGVNTDGSYKLTRHGGFYMYSSAKGMVNIENAHLKGGGCGLRVKWGGSADAVVNIKNSIIEGTHAIAIDGGTVNIGENVTTIWNENLNSYGDPVGYEFFSGYKWSYPNTVKINRLNSETDKIESCHIDPDYPRINSMKGDDGTAVIGWTVYPYAVKYRVYYRNANGSWSALGTTKDLTFTDTTIKNGETRIYTVRAIDSNGQFCSSYKSEGWSFNNCPNVKAITNVKAGGARLAWDKYYGATYYRVYEVTSSGYKRIAETTSKSYVDTSIVKGQTKTYTVRALNSKHEWVSYFNEDGWTFTKP